MYVSVSVGPDPNFTHTGENPAQFLIEDNHMLVQFVVIGDQVWKTLSEKDTSTPYFKNRLVDSTKPLPKDLFVDCENTCLIVGMRNSRETINPMVDELRKASEGIPILPVKIVVHMQPPVGGMNITSVTCLTVTPTIGVSINNEELSVPSDIGGIFSDVEKFLLEKISDMQNGIKVPEGGVMYPYAGRKSAISINAPKAIDVGLSSSPSEAIPKKKTFIL